MTSPVLDVRNLKAQFDVRDGVVRAVDGVSFSVPAGKTVCIVGESGCGKSVTARSILGLVEPPGRVVGGEILWRNPSPAEPVTGDRLSGRKRGAPASTEDGVDLVSLAVRGQQLRQIRGGEIAMIFQEPMASLSPMYTVGEHLVEVLQLRKGVTKAEATEQGIELLRQVGIPNPKARMSAYPFQLSGGMSQRVMIALAISCDPALLIADEPTTALDVTTQARILDLLRRIQAERGMSMMFITHDLGVVGEIADEVVVMYLGTVVEQGPVDQIFHHPRHPYTRALLASVPQLGEQSQRTAAIRGNVPNPLHRPAGCPFHPRCASAIRGVCDVVEPPTVAQDDSSVRCVLYEPELIAGTTQLQESVPPPAPGATSSAAVSERRQTAAADAALPDPTVVDPSDPSDLLHAPSPTAVPAQPAIAVASATPSDAPPMLSLRDVRLDFPGRRARLFGKPSDPVHALNGVDLDVRQGEILGVVGESGCGKSTLGRVITGVYRPTSGDLRYRPDGGGEEVDLVAATGAGGRRRLQRDIRIILQDPYTSLNPRMTVGQIVGDPLRASRSARGSEIDDRVAEMLIRVGLSPAHMRRYPHAFSGGERQRVSIARALIMKPRMVVADEAVSALDVSVQAQILELLAELRHDLDLTLMFISHDLSVVEQLCDRVAVMYLGRVVELADSAELYREPKHPYTTALLSAIPDPDPRHRGQRAAIPLSDDLPDPTNLPTGCLFQTRCPHAVEQCRTTEPALRAFGPHHRAACHLADELVLSNSTGPGSPAVPATPSKGVTS